MVKKLIILLVLITSITYGEMIENKEVFEIIKSENVLNVDVRYQDINGSIEELENSGLKPRIVALIADFREKTGGFEDIGELKLIKGIGKSTYDKLRKQLKVKTKIQKKPLFINRSDTTILTYYGFSKKEIKKIEQFMEKNGKIKSNLELLKLLPKERYEKYKGILKYN